MPEPTPAESGVCCFCGTRPHREGAYVYCTNKKCDVYGKRLSESDWRPSNTSSKAFDTDVFIPMGAAAPEKPKYRATYLKPSDVYNLEIVCETIRNAFGDVCLVGSALERADYRDVDLRTILADADFDRMFPGSNEPHHLHRAWHLTCMAISEWASARTGLPIDFQIQRMTGANAKYAGRRNSMGFVQLTGDPCNT